MDKTKEFYDDDVERMLSGNDSTVPYEGSPARQEEPRQRHRPMRFDDDEREQEDDAGFYDSETERLMGSGSGGKKREDFRRSSQRGYEYGRRGVPSFDDYGAETKNWKPALHGENEVEAFDGRFFRAQDEMGNSVIRLVMENMSASEMKSAEDWYRQLGMIGTGFLHRAGTSARMEDGCAVFDFEIRPHTYSLGELYRQKKLGTQNAERIMRQLNNLITEYRKARMDVGLQYRALNCLSLDTVFLDQDNRLTVLPVYYNGRNYPVEIAREAMVAGRRSDERSDLYAAAYVAVEVYSNSNGDKPLLKPESEVIQACLQVIPDWRPTPKEVGDWLNGKRPKPQTLRGGTPRNTPVRKPNANKWLGKLMEWVKSWKELEEPEGEDDTDETADPSDSGSRGSSQDGDDSWYDYGRK